MELQQLTGKAGAECEEAPVKVLDAAYWVKGCNSLGLLRYAVLADFGGRRCLIDIKKAVAATSPRSPRISMPRDNARRVLQCASQLAPALGERMQARLLWTREYSSAS